MLDYEPALQSVLEIQSRYMDWQQDSLSQSLHAHMTEPLQKAMRQSKEADEAKLEELAKGWFDQLSDLFSGIQDPWLVGENTYDKVEIDSCSEVESKSHAFAKEVLDELAKLFQQGGSAIAVANPLRMQLLKQEVEETLYIKAVAAATEEIDRLNDRLDLSLTEMEATRAEIVRLEDERQALVQKSLEEAVEELAKQYKTAAGELDKEIATLKSRVDGLTSSYYQAQEATAAKQAELIEKQKELVAAQNTVRVEVRETVRYVKKKSSGMCNIL